MHGDYGQETYVVQPQDTLYSIAWRHDLDYRDLARWNGIGPDYRISVGQILTLRPAARRARFGPAPLPATAKSAPAHRRAAEALHRRRAQETDIGTLGIGRPRSRDPARRRRRRHSIGGSLGQPVRAACSGRIVYVGNGIRGYGNLIIIKHDDNFLSAYAHTREIEVHEGQEVPPRPDDCADGRRAASDSRALLRDPLERQAHRSAALFVGGK